MKYNRVSLLILFIILSIFLSSCGSCKKNNNTGSTGSVSNIDITYLSFAGSKIVLGINESIEPEIIILPEQVNNINVTLSVNPPDLLLIEGRKITGLKTGTGKLTVSSSSLSSEIDIEVKESVIKPNKITLSADKTVIEQGENIQLSSVIEPVDADNKNIIYTSSDNNIAVVTKDGIVTGQNAGSATITAVAEADRSISSSIAITVNEATGIYSGMTFSKGGRSHVYLPVENGSSSFINVDITPKNAKYTKLNVTSSSDAVLIDTVTRNSFHLSSKKQGYLADIEVTAEGCGLANEEDCKNILTVLTYDNNTNSSLESISTVMPYNITDGEGRNQPIYIRFGETINPLASVILNPNNATISQDSLAINLPDTADGQNPLIKTSNNKVSAQSTGKGVIVVEYLDNQSIKPLVFDVYVYADESEIPDIALKPLKVESITISNKENLQSKLSVTGGIEPVNAVTAHEAGQGYMVEDYSISTSDKNIIDIIDGYAYAKKAGTATITVKSNNMFSAKGNDIVDSITITVN